MISIRQKRVVWLGALAVVVLGGSALAACSSSDSTGTTGGNEAGGGGETGTDASIDEDDGSVPPQDGGKDAALDAPRDANVRDANGPGALDAICSFNWDCQSALRCECDEATGCACKPGARGTGRNGIDPCASGNACASAVCVEGPPDSGSFCSDECGTSADCVGQLPVCTTISFVGRICVRTPPK